MIDFVSVFSFSLLVERKEGSKDGRTDGRKDGRTDGRKEGRTD